ncbi:hypothetical protein SK128_015382 [Halocaridina rubra]|uniref:Transmembrane protein n=1 Tax=Halocaridina rubra TaxID=373956 RepID=A0AAN8ZXU4_HALRR
MMKCLSNDGKPILVFGKCCCFSLRTGVLVIASLEIFFEILVLLLHIVLASVFVTGNLDKEQLQISNHSVSLDQPQVTQVEHHGSSDELMDKTLRLVLHETVAVVVSVILIYGVKKNRVGLMKMWIWVRAINLLDDMIDVVSISDRFQTFMFMFCLVLPCSITAILVVRSYITQLTSNDSFVQLEEVREDV